MGPLRGQFMLIWCQKNCGFQWQWTCSPCPWSTGKARLLIAFLPWVDRLSGWMLAPPSTKLGLTGEKAAHLMLDGGWGEMGVPAQITSDQGAQFVSQWFRTICARLGVRMAFSQAYRPQANGRAEVAGKTLITTLRKLHFEENVNWVEALPHALRLIHDRVGEGGMSPHQIVFGRDRNLAGLPYTPIHLCKRCRRICGANG